LGQLLDNSLWFLKVLSQFSDCLLGSEKLVLEIVAAVVLSGFMLGVLVSGNNNLGVTIARLFELDQSGGQLLREFVQFLKFRGRFRYTPFALFFVCVHSLTLRAQASL